MWVTNNDNLKVLGILYLKKKINYLFSNSMFIIFLDLDLKNILNLKYIFLKYNIFSMVLKSRYVKALFNMPNFLFLKGNQYLCGFINDLDTFIKVSKSLDNTFIFYSYKNRLSNMIRCDHLINLFDIYNKNHIYIQFLLKKMKIKVIILFLFFLISFTHYVK